MDAREIPSFQSEIKTGNSLNEIKSFSYHDVTHSTCTYVITFENVNKCKTTKKVLF